MIDPVTKLFNALHGAESPEEFREAALAHGAVIESEHPFRAVSDGGECVNFVLLDSEGFTSLWSDRGLASAQRVRDRFGWADRFNVTHRFKRGS